MPKKEWQAEILLFKVLSNETRLRIIDSLRGGDRSVTELCEKTQENQTRISHELRCLTVCGVVNYERDGKRIIYSLNKKTVLPILEAADKHVETYADRMKGCDMVSEARRMKVVELTV